MLPTTPEKDWTWWRILTLETATTSLDTSMSSIEAKQTRKTGSRNEEMVAIPPAEITWDTTAPYDKHHSDIMAELEGKER